MKPQRIGYDDKTNMLRMITTAPNSLVLPAGIPFHFFRSYFYLAILLLLHQTGAGGPFGNIVGYQQEYKVDYRVKQADSRAEAELSRT